MLNSSSAKRLVMGVVLFAGFVSVTGILPIKAAEQGCPSGRQLELLYTMVRNAPDGNSHTARWTLTNHGSVPFPKSDWGIYFNQLQLVRAPLPKELPGGVRFEHVSGDLYRLVPGSGFAGIPAGGSFAFEYTGGRPMVKESWGPEGVYVVYGDQAHPKIAPELLGKVHMTPLPNPAQWMRGDADAVPNPTAENLYRQNSTLKQLASEKVGKITPTPIFHRATSESICLDANWTIVADPSVSNEGKALQKSLEGVLQKAPQLVAGSEGGAQKILLKTGPVTIGHSDADPGPEAYALTASNDKGIVIRGTTPAGVFYGIQTLLQLLPPEAYQGQQANVSLDGVLLIEDAPRFTYRGMHMDISHNYHQKRSILRMIERMAFYKLNVLHLHLSDDEGWRLEIPELPELTALTSTRGHTVTHEARLHPSYGAGPDPMSKTSNGNGHLSRQDFVDILRFATARHVRVVPEIDMPGHSRAAIVAMQAREKRLMAEGKTREALEYRLHDPDDQSKYQSVQGYYDNTVCIAQESVYHFLETVLGSILGMYREAQAPIELFHIGCDEVPQGAWTKSPLCAELAKQHPEWKSSQAMKLYFIGRVNQILRKHKLQTSAWQEAALDHVVENGVAKDNPVQEFADGNLLPYVWNNLEGNEDLAHRFANLGYPTILCCVTNLYFDLAYDKHPLEPGLTWGGYVNARNPFELVPEDLFKSTRADSLGKRYDIDGLYKLRESLTPKGLKNIRGIQGQVWCETIKGETMLDYYCFPKLISLGERAWAKQPAWALESNTPTREAALEVAWNEFANRLGQRELPRMDSLFGGTAYRLPPPGALRNQMGAQANVEYPGLTIRYTVDGSEPTSASPVYQGAITAKGTVKFRTFDRLGRGGRTATVE